MVLQLQRAKRAASVDMGACDRLLRQHICGPVDQQSASTLSSATHGPPPSGGRAAGRAETERRRSSLFSSALHHDPGAWARPLWSEDKRRAKARTARRKRSSAGGEEAEPAESRGRERAQDVLVFIVPGNSHMFLCHKDRSLISTVTSEGKQFLCNPALKSHTALTDICSNQTACTTELSP
ncbi:hypothetical protein SKAU_G00175350 [Synaphobranchus kaupii]|uniref:Uncharacterized protein n=1 Tax=Synaphobranchus kaupii TaxID=118154 RepID=A0A9Q1FLT8_SYNKA|nr:hypothetical protein SKAU_G00175350 [Synaphobranchus kaupii]